MKSLVRAALVLMFAMTVAGGVMAQPETTPPEDTPAALEAVETQKISGTYAAQGMGLSVIGIGLGVGLIGFSALSGIARQPEQAGRIQGAMILLAALVEGAGVISIIFCAFVVA